MANTHFLTLNQAAKEAGKSKATIFKALKNGDLSYIEKTESGYKIDPAELFRVFPKTAEISKNEQTRTQENTQKTAILSTQNEALRRENELLRQQLERERENADHWRQQATNLLTHQPEAKAEPAAPTATNQNATASDPVKPQSSFFAWAFGKAKETA